MRESEFNLDGLVMNAVETDPTGVISVDTIFEFKQSGSTVWAEYKGGKIQAGNLIGTITADTLEFRYCQIQTDSTLDGGVSHCELKRENGLIQIIEHFSWESRESQGRNVIQEIG